MLSPMQQKKNLLNNRSELFCCRHKSMFLPQNDTANNFRKLLPTRTKTLIRLTTLEQKRSFQPQFCTKKCLEVSALLAVRHCLMLQSWAISGKANDGTVRKWQKPYPNLELNLGSMKFFSRALSRQCSKQSFYAISRKTNELNLKN